MMYYNYSGIFYRLWAECGFLLGIGTLLLLIVRRNKGDSGNRQSALAGVLCLLLGVGLMVNYGYCIAKPDIQSFQGVFETEYRNSRVAPPLPLTMEYTFRDAAGKCHLVYLDVLSKKEIFPSGFDEGENYTVIYEGRTNIILKIE